MPFVQMENISHFLRVCQAPPLSLPAHDIFLTVDLYESKDPAQVLQCIEAFSRKVSALHPERIPAAVGGKKATSATPDRVGSAAKERSSYSPQHTRDASNNSIGGMTGSGRSSPTKFTNTAPAWNYAQYGWMGGASQGNQGVTFGSRRQITTPAPKVPSLAEKERKRREAEAEEERQRQETALVEARRQAEYKIQEDERRVAAERQHAEEEARHRKEERLHVEAEKKRWEEEERKWRQEEDERIREEKASEIRLDEDRRRRRANSDARLKGQFLSQYQAEHEQISAEKARISELEQQLAEAKAREQQYENERKRISQNHDSTPDDSTVSIGSQPHDPDEQAWNNTEKGYTRSQQKPNQAPHSSRPLPTPQTTTTPSARPLPVPAAKQAEEQEEMPARPLPNPISYKPISQTPNRTDQYLASNPAPTASTPATHLPSEAAFSSTAESEAEAQRRIASQKATKAGGWASKSLLEREMEQERLRQQEWEAAQKETQDAATKGFQDPNAGSGPGQSWDVHSYGYMGGDNMNKGTSGVYAGRRQILGPRPLEKK